MKRLIDEDLSPGSPERELADLVRATPRFERASFERERILVHVRSKAASPRRRVLSFSAAVLVLSMAAVAAAALGRFWVPRSTSSVSSTPSPEPVASFAPPVPAPPATAPSEQPPSAEQALAEIPATPIVPKAPHEPPSARPRPDARSVESRHPDGEDPGPVLEAIRALRSRGDAARASALLADYLRAHPHSVLSEDALALSIEAAVARHDSRSAADLGRRYLDEFPGGRYKAFALQAVHPGADH